MSDKKEAAFVVIGAKEFMASLKQSLESIAKSELSIAKDLKALLKDIQEQNAFFENKEQMRLISEEKDAKRRFLQDQRDSP